MSRSRSSSLATTKDHAHRICLGRGIYAEVTLTFLKGAFEPMPWTYPDYRTEAYRSFFEQVRADLRKDAKTGEGSQEIEDRRQETEDSRTD